MHTLKELRHRSGLSQLEMAEALHMEQRTIWEIETGRVLPRPGTRQRMEQIIGSPVDWIRTSLDGMNYTGQVPPVVVSIVEYLMSSTQTDRVEKIQFLKRFLRQYENKLKP